MAYNTPYGSPDDTLDPAAQRRQAILDLMDPSTPARTPMGTDTGPGQYLGAAPPGSTHAGFAAPVNPDPSRVYAAGSSNISPDTLSQLQQPNVRPQAEADMSGTNAQDPYVPPAASATPGDDGRHYGSQILDLYQDPYARRGGGTGGVGSGALSGASTGATVGSVIPGVGTAIGAGVGAVAGGILGAIRKHAESAPTDFAVNDARKIIQDSYRDMYGRDATPEEVNTMLQGQGLKPGDEWVGQAGLEGVLGHLAENAAAQRQASAVSAAASTGATGAASGAAPADAAGGNASASGAAAGGGGMPGSLEGFDAGKFADPNKHDTKYDFARIAAQYPPTPTGLDQAWDAIKKQFPNATRIGDDTIDFGDGSGPVDVIRAAGEGGKAWHFEPVGGATDQAAAASTSAATPNAGLGAMPGAAQLAAPLTNNNVLQQIMDEVRRIQSGQQPRAQILDQLGVS